MRVSKSLWLALGAAIPLLMAASPVGVPSRLKVQQVTATTNGGNFTAKGTASGASSISYTQFSDSGNIRKGYIGDGSAGDSDIYLVADAASANIRVNPGTGGDFIVNGVTATPDSLDVNSSVVGCSTTPTISTKVRAFGRLVVANVSSGTTCTSNSISKSLTITGLPANMQSVDAGFQSCAYTRFLDNGVSVDGTVSINGTTLSFGRTGTSNWTSSGTFQLVSGFTCAWVR